MASTNTSSPMLAGSGRGVEATLVDNRLAGVIGGVLDEAQVQDEFLPIVHTALTRSVSRDCDQGVCEPGSDGAIFLGLFDVDGDGALTLDEVRNNELVQTLVEPDLDLFDADGLMAPGCDEVPESLSFAVGFTAVPAQF